MSTISLVRPGRSPGPRSWVLSMFGIRNRFCLIAAVAASAAAVPLAAQANVSAVVDTTVDTTLFAGPVGVLRPGDELNIVIFRNEELTGKYLIDARGFLQIPGLGTIRVAGLTPEAAVERLRAQLMSRGFTSPEIAVRSEEHTSELQSLAYLVCRL